jgi:hypothetical protein
VPPISVLIEGNIEIWKVGDTSATATIDILTATINDNQLIVNLEEDLTFISINTITTIYAYASKINNGIGNSTHLKCPFIVTYIVNTCKNITYNIGSSVNKISTISNFQFFKDGSTIPAVTIDTVAINENGAWSVAH